MRVSFVRLALCSFLWRAGVKHLLGFNEPDNKGQSNLSPAQAATYWHQLDDFALTFTPPLALVGPGDTCDP